MIKLSTNMEEECNTGLSLGIRSYEDYYYYNMYTSKKMPPVQFHKLFPPKPQEEETTKRAKNTTKEDQGGNSRKKLKLTKEQAALLEDSFREQQTLNLTQKKLLADRLKLSSRQVEVWFQNRRARSKLKQTEENCEMLRKWCESLSDENRRLERELQELRSVKPTYGTAMLTICPSCEQN